MENNFIYFFRSPTYLLHLKYVIYFLILILIIYSGFKFFLRISLREKRIIQLDNEYFRKKYHSAICLFEKNIQQWYPLGKDDHFRIDHGPNYYYFFQRLGELHMNIAMHNNSVIATGCGILRNIPTKNNEKIKKIWYIGDVKVRKEYRGQHLPWKLMLSSWWKILKSRYFYAVTMNPNDQFNRVIKLGKRIPLKFEIGCYLNIYSCDYSNMLKAKPILEKHRGPISFLSLHSIKDIILKSSNQPMKLLHVQFDYNKKITERSNEFKTMERSNEFGLKIFNFPQKEYVHMFCCPQQDILAKDLQEIGIITDVTATVLHHSLYDCDWKFILTSDI